MPLYLNWGSSLDDTPLGGADSVEVKAGTGGTFTWTSTPPVLGENTVLVELGRRATPGTIGVFGKPTGSPETPGSFVPFLIFVTNDDLTGPSISSTVTGTLGTAGWYTSAIVAVDWTMTDDKSEITSTTTGCGSAAIKTDGSITLTCSATSAGGTTTKDVTVKRDATAPTLVFEISPAANAAGWNKSDVTVSWTCSDVTSGVATAGDPKTLSGEGANQSATSNCADNAGNTSSSSSRINIDKTAPVLAPTFSQTEILLNAAVSASPNASDALSGIASQSCDAVITTAAGEFSVNCTATDNAGNTATKGVAYVVKSPYTFSGFLAPIAGGSTLNAVTAGSGVPIKFSVGGNQGLSILAAGSPTSKSYACSAASSVVTIATTSVASNGGGLSYDPKTDTYTYSWKTEKSWGGTCRTLILKLTDGIEHTANFSFKK